MDGWMGWIDYACQCAVQTLGMMRWMYWCFMLLSRLGLHVIDGRCTEAFLSDMGIWLYQFPIPTQTSGTASPTPVVQYYCWQANNRYPHRHPIPRCPSCLACLVSTARRTPLDCAQSASSRILFAFFFFSPEGAPRALSLRGRTAQQR